ncbi:hypothetical protein AB0B28_16675 [Glycomyces sp. NPDC046736]|uniref:hypothetical protein n=1 Tax=Glycomyces sp. NPDC046736 TaxID=3155615 RepID=UPI0033C9E505
MRRIAIPLLVCTLALTACGGDEDPEVIPTVEQAEKFAFAAWLFYTDTPEAAEMRDDPDYLLSVADDNGWFDPAEEDAYEVWSAQDPEYQDAWMEAFKGTDRFDYDREMRDAYEEDFDAASERDFGPQPPFGGCELETLDAVYGGPGKSESDGEEFWYRPLPETPLTWVGEGKLYDELSVRYVDEESDFLFCVEERGYGQWEFDDLGWLPTELHLEQFYYPGGNEYGDDVVIPPLAEAAEEFDDPLEYEFAMALDFAECAEDSGLREGTEEAWAKLYIEQFSGREAEVFAWEEGIRDDLANAQDYLAGA